LDVYIEKRIKEEWKLRRDNRYRGVFKEIFDLPFNLSFLTKDWRNPFAESVQILASPLWERLGIPAVKSREVASP